MGPKEIGDVTSLVELVEKKGRRKREKGEMIFGSPLELGPLGAAGWGQWRPLVAAQEKKWVVAVVLGGKQGSSQQGVGDRKRVSYRRTRQQIACSREATGADNETRELRKNARIACVYFVFLKKCIHTVQDVQYTKHRQRLFRFSLWVMECPRRIGRRTGWIVAATL